MFDTAALLHFEANKKSMKRVRYVVGYLMMVGIVLSNVSCMDLAIIGISAAVRQKQNDKQIERQRQLEHQRVMRAQQHYRAVQELIRQNQRDSRE